MILYTVYILLRQNDFLSPQHHVGSEYAGAVEEAAIAPVFPGDAGHGLQSHPQPRALGGLEHAIPLHQLAVVGVLKQVLQHHAHLHLRHRQLGGQVVASPAGLVDGGAQGLILGGLHVEELVFLLQPGVDIQLPGHQVEQ